MSRSTITLDAKPVSVERLSAAAFLKLVKDNPGIIKSSSIISPRPGARQFGVFEVQYQHPIYKTT